ncbi:MAG TPA: metallophosphoesterase [Vicinamibacterales bacterium]|nr:metallophosphoesterase [Vicinamibacterales bacterium]
MFRPFLTAVLTLFFVSATPSWPVVAFEQATKTTTPQAPKTATPQAPAVPPTSTLPKDDDSVKFLVIGDSGTGDRQQYEVAAKIVEAYAQFPFEFAIMLGDNMYGSERAIDFVNKFEKPYKPLLDAGVKFYASLGNHDDPSQRFYAGFNMDGKRYYTFSKKDVEFFVLDSTYMAPPQVSWLREELKRSDAKWKISYFHHPIYSSGERHGSELDLQAIVEPLFLENGVDAVFSGHEHFYERLRPQKGIQYMIQGGAAKLRRGNIRDNSPMTAKGFDTDRSFTLVEINGDHLFFETISRLGQVVDSGSFARREIADATSTK